MPSNDKPILLIRGDNDLVRWARSALARTDRIHPIITIARYEEVKHYLAAAGACGRSPAAAIMRATALTLDEDSVFFLEWIQNQPCDSDANGDDDDSPVWMAHDVVSVRVCRPQLRPSDVSSR